MTREAAPRQWTRTPTIAEFDQLLRQYRDHLTQERGLAGQTVAGYQTVARQFLAHVASSTGFDLSGLDAAVVSQFVVRAGQTHCIGSTKHVVTGCGHSFGSCTGLDIPRHLPVRCLPWRDGE